MPLAGRLTAKCAALMARVLTTANRNAAERFARWYGRKTIQHPNYVGPIEWERTIHTRFDMTMRVRFQEALGRALILNSVYEPEVTDRVKATLKPGDVFIDVGANMGYFTLLGSRLVGPDGLVIAFEPSIYNLPHLASNIALNRCRNVLLRAEAVTDHAALAKFSLPWPTNAGVASLGNGPSADLKTCFQSGYSLTATTSLDPVLQTLIPGRSVRLVKVDAEGHEPQVLQGMEELLRREKEIKVVCEVSPQCYSITDLWRYMANLGFKGEFYSSGRWQQMFDDHLPPGLCNAWFSRN
jgi:FkbM family methyltransferase